MKTTSKGINGAKEPSSKCSAGIQRKNTTAANGGAGNATNTVRLLSSHAPSKAGTINGINRSNSISRKSVASNSSMAVNQGNESASQQRKGKCVKPVPRG